MNYWIKINVFLFVILGYSINAFTQIDSTITVKGTYTYSVKPKSFLMEFSFVENGVTCGPNTQFESIDEQFNYFVFNIISDKSISDRIKLVDKIEDYFKSQPTRTYEFEFSDYSEMKKMYNWAEEGFAENFAYYNIYSEAKLEEQDEYAIEAFKDAERRAKKIANLRGFKNLELVSIDDNTGTMLGMQRAYTSLNKMAINFKGASARERNYYILATFKLK